MDSGVWTVDEFMEVNIKDVDRGAGWGGPSGMGQKSMVNLFGNRREMIIYGEEELSKVDG